MSAPENQASLQAEYDEFVKKYAESCKDKPADHNEIGLYYFRDGWNAAIAWHITALAP